MSKHRIIVGDCLKWMRKQPDRSIDLVLCSPPYEDARTYDMAFSLKGDAYVDWCVERYLECDRICKGLVVWVMDSPVRQFEWGAAPFLVGTKLKSLGVKLRRPCIYHRHGIFGSGSVDDLRNDFEIVLRSSHGRLPWADPLAFGTPPKYPPGGPPSHRLKDGTRVKKKAYVAPKLANPGNVLHCTVGGGHMGHALAHDTEAPFPLQLAEFYVRTFCPPDGVVLDPFAGSGTTMHAAYESGRRSINIDIRESQGDLMRKRLVSIRS